MQALVAGNLGLRFVLELSALAAVGYWGWTAAGGVARPLLAGAAVAAVVLVWGAFVSPNPAVPLAPAVRLLIEGGVWAAAAAALAATGQPRMGGTFLAVAVASGLLNHLWR